MEYVGIASILKWGTPGALLVLIILVIYLLVKLEALSKSVFEMKHNIVWKDTHDEMEKNTKQRFKSVEKDVDRLNKKVFNGVTQ